MYVILFCIPVRGEEVCHGEIIHYFNMIGFIVMSEYNDGGDIFEEISFFVFSGLGVAVGIYLILCIYHAVGKYIASRCSLYLTNK